jgi:hypothetical protein
MKKRLLTVGDSFTYGDELDNPADTAWPALVAAALDSTLTNLGKPGRGNTHMVRTVVEESNNFDAVIVAWSHSDRIEIADEYDIFDTWPGRINVPFKHQYPWRANVTDYYSRHHNDDYLYRQYLLNIVLVQSYLKLNNKPYLMFDVFGNHQDLRRTDERNNDLIKQIDTQYFIGWPDEAMVDWMGDCLKGPRGHPLELGHQQTAEHINEYIRNISWLS